SDRRLVSLIEVPVPRMHLQQVWVITTNPVKAPIYGGNVDIIERPVSLVREALGPAARDRVIIRELGRIVIEEASFDRVISILQIPPQRRRDVLLKLGDLLCIRLD